MIDLEWIIQQENHFTDRARFDLGDNYHLSIELLKLLQSIKSFSVNNEVAHVFETQILNDFHLVILNSIRRHTVIAHIILRHALEMLVMFAYSMENTKEEDFDIIREKNEVIDFNDRALENAYKHIEKKYSEYSKDIEGYKEVINTFYAHANVYSGQGNITEINGRLKSLFFDGYVGEMVRNILLIINDVMCLTLKFYQRLQKDYKSFYFDDDFDKNYNEALIRHRKLVSDYINSKQTRQEPAFLKVNKILKKLDKKYNKT